MDRHQLLQFSNKLFRKLKQQAEEIRLGCAIGSVHHFRTEYKKLRAFLEMLSHNSPNSGIEIPKKLREAYTVTGSIRNLQLQQLRVAKVFRHESKQPRAYLNLLQHEIDKVQPELEKLFAHDIISTSRKKTNAVLTDKFTASEVELFVAQQLNIILAIISLRSFRDDELHHIRRILKDLLYLVSHFKLPERSPTLAFLFKIRDDFHLTELINELGNLQDHRSALTLVSTAWLGKVNAHNRSLLSHLKKEWIREKLELKLSLINKLNQLYSVLHRKESHNMMPMN